MKPTLEAASKRAEPNPRSHAEQTLLGLVRAIAEHGSQRSAPQILRSSLTELGVASLGALTLQYQIEAQLGLLISLDRLLSADSVEDIVSEITLAQRDGQP